MSTGRTWLIVRELGFDAAIERFIHDNRGVT